MFLKLIADPLRLLERFTDKLFALQLPLNERAREEETGDCVRRSEYRQSSLMREAKGGYFQHRKKTGAERRKGFNSSTHTLQLIEQTKQPYGLSLWVGSESLMSGVFMFNDY